MALTLCPVIYGNNAVFSFQNMRCKALSNPLVLHTRPTTNDEGIFSANKISGLPEPCDLGFLVVGVVLLPLKIGWCEIINKQKAGTGTQSKVVSCLNTNTYNCNNI